MMPYRIPGESAAEPAAPVTETAEPQPAAEPVVEPAAEPAPATAGEGMHPLALSNEEGVAAVPQEKLIKELLKLSALKAGGILMYHTYADALRTPARDGLAEHFEEHAKEERAGLYDFNMKVIALGGNVSSKVHKFPEAAGIQEILMAVIQYEKEQLMAARTLLKAVGEYDGLRLLVEESILKDQRHLDDARRMLVTLP